jgi:oxygen-dependent protoporphyrinogen oxidase
MPALSGELAAIATARVAAVHLAWKPSSVPGVDGFGWLAPSSQRTDALGVLWVSSAFPGHAPGRTLVRVMLGGARDRALPAEPEALVARAHRVMREVQGFEAEPTLSDTTLAWLPQYDRGHGARIARLDAAMPGLRFLGWGYGGIGLEACIRSADGYGLG